MLKLSCQLPVSIFKEGKHFIAYTPVLDLSTSAKTYDEAKKRFFEAVDIFFEYTTKKGTLDIVLKDLGWRKVNKNWMPPVLVSQEMEGIKIPVTA
jgi:hypothetical protein